jgi:tRNA C32,U32 (ribose-2'-O)-methylase TrmJ
VGLHSWLKKRIGKREALRVASTLEKVILIFGREQIGDRI